MIYMIYIITNFDHQNVLTYYPFAFHACLIAKNISIVKDKIHKNTIAIVFDVFFLFCGQV